jgi:adenylate kinase family enzyme
VTPPPGEHEPFPWLSADDALPRVPRRVVVAGTSAAGKSTLAARISQVLDIPHTEIDALFHGPGWVPREDFVADVERFSAEPAWVTEWLYSAVRELLLNRADTLVWLDVPRPVVMSRLVRRTLWRRLRRETLWNGNVEPPLWTFFTERDHIVRWAWRSHRRTARRVAAAAPEHPEIAMVRLRTRREIERWVGALRTSGPDTAG